MINNAGIRGFGNWFKVKPEELRYLIFCQCRQYFCLFLSGIWGISNLRHSGKKKTKLGIQEVLRQYCMTLSKFICVFCAAVTDSRSLQHRSLQGKISNSRVNKLEMNSRSDHPDILVIWEWINIRTCAAWRGFPCPSALGTGGVQSLGQERTGSPEQHHRKDSRGNLCCPLQAPQCFTQLENGARKLRTQLLQGSQIKGLWLNETT